MRWQGLTVEQIQLWETLYDGVDVVQVLKQDIPQWLDKWKGTKKVRKVRWDRFICNWLKRAHQREVGL